MHSSRMCTARLLTVSQHALLGGVPARGCTCLGVYLPGGCTCTGYTCLGVYLPTGVPTQGGVPVQVLPPVNRMTDRCQNITLPQTSFAGGNKCKIRVPFPIRLCYWLPRQFQTLLCLMSEVPHALSLRKFFLQD